MKLLLRQFGDECYVWKNAEMNDEKTFIVDGRTVNQGNVVSIYRDNRNKFVKCSHCGTILKNTDAEIKPNYEGAWQGEWQINVNKIPEQFRKYAAEIDEVFNDNVPCGCCGGCI